MPKRGARLTCVTWRNNARSDAQALKSAPAHTELEQIKRVHKSLHLFSRLKLRLKRKQPGRAAHLFQKQFALGIAFKGDVVNTLHKLRLLQICGDGISR